MNLLTFDQAKYIDEFAQDQVDFKDCLAVKVLGKKLNICVKSPQIEVYDHKTSLKHVFRYSSQELGVIDLSHIFTLKKN